ncbi:MAG: EmrB/QacA family drug resistance transporter, partial [Acetobacteraceae bacterium]|nr:EmrB/QacA family drug resistance transporter [Acetobacteraceae bacterium]
TTVLSFVTLPPYLRGEATAVQSLFRNIGAAAGISIVASALANSAQISHAGLAAGITPFNRNLQDRGVMSQMLDPRHERGARRLDAMISREATVIAYSNDFLMMSYIVFPPLLLLPFMRRTPRPTLAVAKVAAAAE